MSPPSYPSAWLHPCRARFRFTWQSHCSLKFPAAGSRPALFSLFARLLQFAISRRMDLRLPPGQHVRWREVADGAVKAYRVVVLHVLLDEPLPILLRQRRARPDALPFERFVPTFDFSVRLRLKRRSPARDHANRRDVSRAVGERWFGERGGTPALRLGVQRAVIQPSAAVPQIRKALLANRRFDCVGVQPAPVAHHAQGSVGSRGAAAYSEHSY